MIQYTKHLALASGFLFLGLGEGALAQTALSSCNPATGLTPAGQQCVTLTPIDATRYQTQISGEGASSYRPVNVGQLAETYQCDAANAYGSGGGAGSILIEDCGAPLQLDPATFQEFIGYSGAPTYTPPPAPVQVVSPPPPPVQVLAPPPPPPLTAPVPVMAPAGLGNAGLVAAGIGAAALVGIIAIALDDDDDNNTAATTTGR